MQQMSFFGTHSCKDCGIRITPQSKSGLCRSCCQLGKRNGFYGKRHTDETKQHIREIHQGENSFWYGKKHTEETKRKQSEAQSGSKHPMWGTNHTKEHREKIADAMRGEKNHFYGATHTASTRRALSNIMKDKFRNKTNHPRYGIQHTMESRKKMSERKIGKRTGSKNHAWRGGYKEKQLPNFLRTEILFRDDYTCKICGVWDVNVHIHHINHNNKDNRRINLISLCVSCHSRETHYYGSDHLWMRDAKKVIAEWIELCEV